MARGAQSMRGRDALSIDARPAVRARTVPRSAARAHRNAVRGIVERILRTALADNAAVGERARARARRRRSRARRAVLSHLHWTYPWLLWALPLALLPLLDYGSRAFAYP